MGFKSRKLAFLCLNVNARFIKCFYKKYFKKYEFFEILFVQSLPMTTANFWAINMGERQIFWIKRNLNEKISLEWYWQSTKQMNIFMEKKTITHVFHIISALQASQMNTEIWEKSADLVISKSETRWNLGIKAKIRMK